MANVFSSNVRIAAATPFATVAAGAALVARVSAVAGKKIAGKENWGKVPFSNYVDKHVHVDFGAAMEAAEKSTFVSRKENHSPEVVLNKDGFWEPKEAGKGAPSLYKAANKARMVLVAGKQWEEVPSYPDKEGNFHSLAGWTLHGIRQHAEWREREGDEGVWTPKTLKSYLNQVLRLCADPEEVKGKKLPSFEELVKLSGEEWGASKAAPATKTAPAKATPVPAPEVEVPVEDDGLPRDGGAPGQAAPAPASGEAARTFTALIKELHLGRITEGNALTKAKAVAAAYEAGTINAAELDSLRKAIEKKFKGDQEQLEAAFAA